MFLSVLFISISCSVHLYFFLFLFSSFFLNFLGSRSLLYFLSPFLFSSASILCFLLAFILFLPPFRPSRAHPPFFFPSSCFLHSFLPLFPFLLPSSAPACFSPLLPSTAPLAGSEEDDEVDDELVANYQRAISASEKNQGRSDIRIGIIQESAANNGTVLESA